jgi:hypothetical protein
VAKEPVTEKPMAETLTDKGLTGFPANPFFCLAEEPPARLQDGLFSVADNYLIVSRKAKGLVAVSRPDLSCFC